MHPDARQGRQCTRQESEQLIQGALENLCASRTVIAIAYRLSTLLTMDRIVVLDGDHIVEQGTHEDLLALGGRPAPVVPVERRPDRLHRPGQFRAARRDCSEPEKQHTKKLLPGNRGFRGEAISSSGGRI
ncbi:hypothetical protein FRAHR75_330056 [Frankia sp. Hr75.2]|nr:hypothetical protein FRAHR75_330056 [Frankia sp. Hr75.2]